MRVGAVATRAREVVRRPLFAIVAEGFGSRLSFGIVSFALPLYAFHLGLGLPLIGLLTSFNLLVAVLLKPAMGRLADRRGIKRVVVLAIVLRSLVTLLLVVAVTPAQLFAVRAVHGVSIAMREPGINALIADAGGKRAVASSFAWYQTAKTVAGNAGRVLAGVLIAASGSRYPVVFVAAFVASLAPLVVVRGVRDVAAPPASPDPEPRPPSRRRLWLWSWLLVCLWLRPQVATTRPVRTVVPAREPDARTMARRSLTASCMGLGFAISGTAYLMANLFPILATEYAGLNPAAAGSVYLLSTVVALSGPAWGWVADHVSHRLVLSVRSVGNVASSVVWLLFPTFAGVAAGRMLDDVGKAAFRPAWGALMARVAERDRTRRARTMGYLSMGEDAGEMLGPVVAGLIWSAFGLPAVLVVRALAGVATEIYAVRVVRRLDDGALVARSATGHAVADRLRRLRPADVHLALGSAGNHLARATSAEILLARGWLEDTRLRLDGARIRFDEALGRFDGERIRLAQRRASRRRTRGRRPW